MADPRRTEMPRDEGEVVELLRRAERDGLPVRPVGAGHSFTPLARTDGVTVRLDRLSGLRAVDPVSGAVRVKAGTRLRDLTPLLAAHGLALENMGDIDTQALAGAISTGTHGTGRDFTGLAGQVRGLRMVLADGSVADCSATHRPDLFQAGRIGLGALGILTEVTLQCVPAFRLAANEHPAPLSHVLEHFDDLSSRAEHVEFYWFPHTATALVKSNRRLPADAPGGSLPRWRAVLDDELVSNGVFGATCAAGWIAPQVVPFVNRVAARVVSTREFTDDSAAVFTSPRRVRFREMEYAIDRSAVSEAIGDIRSLIARKRWRISFPLEIRTAAADDVWLSTAYQRPSAYIAVHRYFRDPFAEYFLAVQDILLRYGGRPHWGKLHTLSAARLREIHPRFEDWVTVRNAVDPGRRFRNDHLDRVVGR